MERQNLTTKKILYLVPIGLLNLCCLFSAISIIEALSISAISRTETLRIIIVGVLPFSLAALTWIRFERTSPNRFARELILLLTTFWLLWALLGFVTNLEGGNTGQIIKNLLRVLLPIGIIVLIFRVDIVAQKLAIVGKATLGLLWIWIKKFPEQLIMLKYLVMGKQTHVILQQKAKRDYENARGYTHLKMLVDAQLYYQQEKLSCLNLIERLKHKLQQADPSSELEEALSKHIVQTELQHVSGIGPRLQARIVDSIFRNSLNDLHRADRLEGIGDERQWSISRWVRETKETLPERLKHDFPGKGEIIDRHQALQDNISLEVISKFGQRTKE